MHFLDSLLCPSCIGPREVFVMPSSRAHGDVFGKKVLKEGASPVAHCKALALYFMLNIRRPHPPADVRQNDYHLAKTLS